MNMTHSDGELPLFRARWLGSGGTTQSLRNARRHMRASGSRFPRVLFPPLPMAPSLSKSQVQRAEAPTSVESDGVLQTWPAPPILNVLLMLATTHPPHPTLEMRYHAATAQKDGITYLITTRQLADLIKGKSVVAFYGNNALDNAYLGCGCYEDYIALGSDRGKEILAGHPLYQTHGVPKNVCAFIALSHVCLREDGQTLDTLEGEMRRGHERLTLYALPEGPARIQVYYFSQRHYGPSGQ